MQSPFGEDQHLQAEPVPRSQWAWQVTRRLLGALARHSPRRVAAVVALTLSLSVTSGVSLVMLVPLLDLAGLDIGGGGIGRIGSVAAGGFAALGLEPSVPVVILLYVAVVGAGAGLKRAQSVSASRLYEGFVMHSRRDMYRSVADAEWTYFARQKSSRFVHVLTQELERVGGAASTVVSLAVRATIAMIYLAVALVVSFWMTLAVVVSGGILAALLARKTALGRRRGEAVSASYEELYGTITEQLSGMRVTKSHGVEDRDVRRFADRTDATATSLIEVVRNKADVAFWLEVGSAAILAGMFWIALVVLGLPVAGLLLLLYLFARLVPMATGLQRSVHALLDLLPAFERVEAFRAQVRASAEPRATGPSRLRLTRLVRLDHVTFSYGEAGEVLRDVDLEIEAGATTAVVGPSGAGKSTIADLVVGLVAPDAGVVRVDGQPLEGPERRSWRQNIGYVDQDTFLFHDTIRENLRLAAPEADEEAMTEALRAASAGFVLDLPQGLDTIVGDRGVRLSGGERQRIALARAILRRPALLVLDEATSALDAENERMIQRAIERISGQQTILLIAHRLSTVRAADRLYVVDGGRVVESGTWESLLAREDGRFAALCRAQGLSAPPTAITPTA